MSARFSAVWEIDNCQIPEVSTDQVHGCKKSEIFETSCLPTGCRSELFNFAREIPLAAFNSRWPIIPYDLFQRIFPMTFCQPWAHETEVSPSMTSELCTE
jgi:hypothetical protein